MIAVIQDVNTETLTGILLLDVAQLLSCQRQFVHQHFADQESISAQV